MSKVWNIYSKNIPVSGTPKYVAENLEYHDIWMGEEYVLVSFNSPSPMSIEIGDYLVYRGRVYSIYNVPSALKKARINTRGDAFRYENVKFSSRAMELSEVRFLDIVLGDNQLHYTSLPTFSVYCETVDDLVDRLQANTDRVKNEYDYWYFITPDKQRTLQRIIKWDETQQEWVPDYARRAIAEALWDEYFSDEDTVSYDRTNVNIQIDKSNVWDGLSMVNKNFALNFITNDKTVNRSVIIGAKAKHSAHLFRYGKNNGLYEIERAADSEQAVVTKLFAYGSETNLPYHYYAQLSRKPYFVVSDKTSVEYIVSHPQLSFICNTPFGTFSPYVTGEDNKVTIYNGYNYCVAWCEAYTPEGSDVELTRFRLISDYHTSQADTILYNSVSIGDRVYISSGVNVNAWPFIEYDSEGLPDNMAVNCLMLPGFPKYALNDVVKCEYVDEEGGEIVNETRFFVRNTPDDEYSNTPSFILNGDHVFTFSTDRLRPWIKSPNVDTLGIKEGDIHFTEENDDNGLQEIHPSIEGMTEDDVFHNGSNARLDEIVSADIIDDNGFFAESDTKPNFHVTLKNLGFDLRQAYADAGSSMKLSMKDGYCGGREFSVKGVSQLAGGQWQLTLERLPDSALELYFPYSDAAAHGQTPSANEPYQIRSGDHFVLTDILIYDTNYINAASAELFKKSVFWLFNNDYTRFTYLPKIDEIFMARNNDEEGDNSEYATLKAGEMIDFSETDFYINASIYIDQLTIKEGGNQNIPTFDVVLREEKQVGSLQRIQNQINSIVSGGAGSGLGPKAVQQLIESWVTPRFLSKINSDTAQKLITFTEGILSLNDSTFTQKLNVSKDATFGQKLKALGDAIFSENAQSDGFTSGMATGRGWQIDKYGNGEMESLKIRSYLEVIELLINRLQAQEGDTMFSDNDQIEAVEEREDETDHSISYILTLKEKWDGYFTSQMYGNILKGIINTLAAKEAGVSDETSTSVEVDGANKYYTSWMRVVATHNTDNTLDINQIRVVLYGDNDVPAQRNFAPCNMMAIARWGCIDYSSSDASAYAAEGLSTEQAIAASIKKRQTVFYLSSNEGRIVKMTGVNKPILEEGNYGMVFGNIPDFIRSWDSWQRLVTEHPHLNDRDYLYAQGLIYEDLVHVDITGAPVPIDVDCGDWVKGDAQGVTPSIGHGIYFNVGWNDTNKQFERHRVRHNNGIWLCLQNQPVVINGVATYYEPKFGSLYWKLVDGNGNYTIEFVSSKGYTFRRGYVNTVITPHIFFGNVDITEDIDAQYINWTRQSESGGSSATDPTWNAQHTGLYTRVKTLTLTNADMPSNWSSADKCIFTCTVTINDGQSTIIVDNQVIA